MNRTVCFLMLTGCIVLISCASTRNYSPTRKFSREVLQEDFSLLKEILEKKHPGIYWYTSKDSMDLFFVKYYRAIADSMTEQQFTWQILAPMVDKIHCGHTSVGSSKAYRKWMSGKRLPSFPLYLKAWNDTFAVLANLNRKDSLFKRGTLITSINGISNKQQLKNMFSYLPEDGYANTVNYNRISSNFPYYHRNIYGLSNKYKVSYIDSSGKERKTEIALYTHLKDTTVKPAKEKKPEKKPGLSRVNRLRRHRSLAIDSSGLMATITLNTFSQGRLRSFFRKSFKEINKKNINHLVLDLRSNGGGKVAASTLLTKYISRQQFKVADSLYASSRGLGKYARYIKGGRFNDLEMFLISRRRNDGKYHIGLMEKKFYKPKKHNHFDGKLYVLTSGSTFSASALFCNVVKGQDGITLLGEETGGGWHGNSGIMIPDIKLPHTKTTVRLPLFRLVQYNHVQKTGTGIIPDIYVGTDYRSLIKGEDYKMKVVKELIWKNL